MALQKEKLLANGTSGNYWRVSVGSFKRFCNVIHIDVVLDLFKDSTPGLAPLGCSHQFSFSLTAQELVGNLVALSYTKIKAYANSDIPNLVGSGTHKGCPDIVDALDV